MKARVLLVLAVLVGSVIAVPATGTVAAEATSHWWVTLAFANRKLGAVVEGSGVEQAARCELSLYTTSNGGVTWTDPVELSKAAACDAGGSTDEMAITADGNWFLATPQGLFRGRVDRTGFELVPAGRLVPSMRSDAFCSVAATGKSVWVVIAEGCPASRSAVVLLYSGDDGSTWARPAVPLASVAEFASTFATPPDSLAVESPGSAWLVGWANANGPLLVARTSDGGRTWRTSSLPCKDAVSSSGFVTAAGNRLAALCLGDPTAGYEPVEVVTSTNGGATWSERCDNGPPGLVRVVGSCPRGGYPGAIFAMADGALVMALGYPVGGVAASLDGGRTWKVSLRSAASFLDMSQGSGVVWMLAVGPVGPGLRLAESADGRRWHAVALPTPS